MLVRRIAEDIESRVRRSDPSLPDATALLAACEAHLQGLQAHYTESRQAERMEHLYRQHLQSRLPKLLETIHTVHFA